MQNSKTLRQFLEKNAYLLLVAAWLVTLSFIVDNYWSANSSIRSVKNKISTYIHDQEKDLQLLAKDTAAIKRIVKLNYTENFLIKLTGKKYFLFFYVPDSAGHDQMVFWSTHQVLPYPSLLNEDRQTGFIKLENGYYVWKRFQYENVKIMGLIPVKWNYILSNDYLKNGFAFNRELSLNYDLSTNPDEGIAVNSVNGSSLFYLYQIAGSSHYKNNWISVALRLLAALFVLLFLHFFASFLSHRNLWGGILFFVLSLLLFRYASYYFPLPLNFRQFDLFDPAIYGSNFILRSLGDLLINSLLFVWAIFFLRQSVSDNEIINSKLPPFKKWLLLLVISSLLLLITYQCSLIIRSMVADSQISFDVMDFFSMNIYSLVGFLVLCCLAIGYFFSCQTLLYLVKPYFKPNFLPGFLLIAIEGLLILTFNIGNLSEEFEIFVLIWLLTFIFLLNKSYFNLRAPGITSTKLVFWLVFFSISITVVLIIENNGKELRNRRHYAELLSTKSDPSNETLLNTMLTDFRSDYLATNYERLLKEQSNHYFKDSLVKGNFSGYTNKYDTRVFTYAADEKPLFNDEPTAYNELNSILKTQSKPTGISDLYYFDEAYDKFSYISKKTLSDTAGKTLGYVFILASPKKFKVDALAPQLFGRGQNNSIENSSTYAYAIYNSWKLISSHLDYPFATSLNKTAIPNQQFRLTKQKDYSELWYYAGANKMIVIAKKNRLSIESITMFSYLFCGFLILASIFWFINILIRSKLRLKQLRGYWQLSIRNQIHGTIIFICVVSFLVIGVATILFFINRYETNNRERLSRTIHIMENEIKGSINEGAKMPDMLNATESQHPENLEAVINKISQVHGFDANLYDLNGNLDVSSLSLPYVKGIISTKMDPLAYYHINKKKEVQYFQNEKIGELNYVSNYIPVIDVYGNSYFYLNIPYFTSESNLKNEISNFLVTIINLNAFIFLLAGIVALFITNRITNSFSLISDKMKKINLEKRNEYIDWDRNDELGELVTEYNKMVSKLDESAKALAKTEREGAWSEMARQVAHEIKNPLTPMKLSMQFLQKSIVSNAPNVKELSQSVAQTLIEQIDHLNQIAGEFSQFANIENSKMEIFDINDSLRNIMHLYSSNDKLELSQFLLEGKVIIDADKTHINRLFTNLILNALQAVPENSVAKISVNEYMENDFVVISVSDNGMGIAAEVQSKIFMPNFTTKTSGTGLGLAMCKKIVEQAKGVIYFETEPGSGTVFFVKLPVIKQA